MYDDITVRAARVTDAPGIARVVVDGWQTTYAGILPTDFLASSKYEHHEAATRQHLSELPASSAVFVALREDAFVGVAHVRESPESPSGCAAELAALYVLPSALGRGIGTRLFATVVHWLKERGHQSLSLWVLRDNPYRRFYDRGPGLTQPVAPGGTWRGIIALRQSRGGYSATVEFGVMVRSGRVLPLSPGRHTIAVQCFGVWSQDLAFYWEDESFRR